MKLKNSNCDENQKLPFRQISKFNLWQNSNTQIVTTQILKLRKKSIVTKCKISNCDKLRILNCYLTQTLRLWQTQKLKFGQISIYEEDKNSKGSFSKNNLETLTINEMYSGQRFAILAMFSFWIRTFPKGRGGVDPKQQIFEALLC